MEETPNSRVTPETVTRKTVDDYLKIQGLDQISPEERERLATFAVKFQLNPFLRELHLVPTEEKGQPRFVAVVGYEVYLKKAERTGKLDGWKAWTVGEGGDLKAVLEIYRHDWTHPFVHEVHFAEAVQKDERGEPTLFWQRKPKFQLRKVCISQGFRLCFAEDLGSLPFEVAELNCEDPVARDSTRKSLATNAPTGPRNTFAELNQYLTDNATAFTPKHLRWIQEQLEKTPTLAKASVLLGYCRRVVLAGGLPSDEPRQPRTFSTRPGRKPEAQPEPTF